MKNNTEVMTSENLVTTPAYRDEKQKIYTRK